jgi:hypothetical protein
MAQVQSDHSPTPSTASPITPSGVLVFGSMLGWGPWSAAIGLWLTYGNAGYTLRGQSASTSAVHAYCQAGGTVLQPGICGSVDAHWAYGVALIVVGIGAFLSGLIGLFVLQQNNPRAWRQAVGPIVSGLICGIFAVVVNVVRAIGRAGKAGAGASPSPQSVQPEPLELHWRVDDKDGWQWLSSDGNWYDQQSAPSGAVPPAPPPPSWVGERRIAKTPATCSDPRDQEQ